MNADAFRQLYDYHSAENRATWTQYISQLTDEQFTQPVTFSRGSVRDQIVHMMDADDYWFSALRELGAPQSLDATKLDDRQGIRAQVLRLLNDTGVPTVSQDYIFYVFDRMQTKE